MRLFLIGMLCGVMITAAFTLRVRNSGQQLITGEWRSGIAAAQLGLWTKAAIHGWKWMVEPDPRCSPPKASHRTAICGKVRSERL